MATSKASDSKGKGSRIKSIATALSVSAPGYGIATAVPNNPKSGKLMSTGNNAPVTKVIVLKVNTGLDKLENQTLNDKAQSAKDMFARYRKNH